MTSSELIKGLRQWGFVVNALDPEGPEPKRLAVKLTAPPTRAKKRDLVRMQVWEIVGEGFLIETAMLLVMEDHGGDKVAWHLPTLTVKTCAWLHHRRAARASRRTA